MMKQLIVVLLLTALVLARPYSDQDAQTLTKAAIEDWENIADNLANSPFDDVRTAFKDYLDFQQKVSSQITEYNKKMDTRQGDETAAKSNGKVSDADYLVKLQQDIGQDISFMMMIQLQLNQKINSLVSAVHKYYPDDDWFTQDLLKQVSDSADKTKDLQDKADQLTTVNLN